MGSQKYHRLFWGVEIGKPKQFFRSYVESNEQTELTSQIETDSQIESRPLALDGGGRGGGGVERE